MLSRYAAYHWNLLLDPSKSLNTAGSGYSKEEELLRERKRLVSHGITSYEFDTHAGRVLFRAGCDTYTVDVALVASGATKVSKIHFKNDSFSLMSYHSRLNMPVQNLSCK